MAQIQLPPYLDDKEAELWMSDMASLVNSGTLQDSREAPILVSPNGTRYRLTVANDGTLSTTRVT